MEKNLFKLMNKRVYGGRIKKITSPKSLLTDTKSLIYKIKTQDLYKGLFYLSDYPQRWVWWKNSKFVSLKPKIYSPV